MSDPDLFTTPEPEPTRQDTSVPYGYDLSPSPEDEPARSFMPGRLDEPLGLPRGTVRAILALTIVFSVVAFLIVGAFLLGTEFSLLAAGALIAIATQVVERYFGARSNGS